jgi:hypothetical protein
MERYEKLTATSNQSITSQSTPVRILAKQKPAMQIIFQLDLLQNSQCHPLLLMQQAPADPK